MFQSEIIYLENNKCKIKKYYSNKITILKDIIKNLELKTKSLANELNILLNDNINLDNMQINTDELIKFEYINEIIELKKTNSIINKTQNGNIQHKFNNEYEDKILKLNKIIKEIKGKNNETDQK